MCAMMGGRVAMGDREITEDILTTEKYVTDLYNRSTVEASNQQFRNLLQQIHSDMQHNAKRVFDYMSQKGWYPTSAATPEKINQLRSTVDESRRAIQQFSQQAGISSGAVFGQAGGGGYVQSYPAPEQLPQWAKTETSERGSAGGGYVQSYPTPGQLPQWARTETSERGFAGGGYVQSYPTPGQLPQWGRTEQSAGGGQQPMGGGSPQGMGSGYGMQANLPEWARKEPPRTS